MRSIKSRFAAYALAAILAIPFAPMLDSVAMAQGAPAASQVPQPNQGGVNWSGAGYGAAALLGNVIYIPAKLVYAVLGGIGGGAAWLLTAGNSQTADTIWRSSLGGDYVLTPQMISGSQPINFSGPTDTPPPHANNSAADNVQPLTPIPAPSTAASAPAAMSSGNAQPMDRGTGPVNGSAPLPSTSIE